MNDNKQQKKHTSLRQIFHVWWPLSASWLLTSLEIPILSAVIARMQNPAINLAAYGGLVIPISLIIETPIIMLLPASTTLCKDYRSYKKLFRFMMAAGATLTIIHLTVVFSPIYYFIATKLIGAPKEVIEPARLGLMLLPTWSWAIAYRRFQQGVLIRFGHTDVVGIGSITRLLSNAIVLLTGYLIGSIPGVMVAAVGQAAGTLVEAIYAGIRVQPVLKHQLKHAPETPPLSWKAFAKFYIPLALTSVFSFIWQPLASAAISRMYLALESLAVQSVMNGATFVMRSFAMGYNEVVVSMLNNPRAFKSLRKFTILLAVFTSLSLILIAATPLSSFWAVNIAALPVSLAKMAQLSLWICLPLPALSAYQSWFQGSILFGERTQGITESLMAFLITAGIIMGIGIYLNNIPGIYVSMAAFITANFAQTTWLWYRSRKTMQKLANRQF